ncbi:hypothetical protein MKK69_16450 [Methylobacterium sp. J-026]|uniref:hypothetical protein n=1 Tax=Methylobacterium sp. J-026 TaxID=2836624 RepID=UPI001FBAC7A4|nr:hypothetical protein [Methylobacterium sp. J-026]MCJ2135623.1 hypothetical protein [Methylobacterium sp. J-026]
MITEPGPGQSEAPLATALGVFRTTLVTFAREIANRDPQLAANAFEAAQAAMEDRLGGGSDTADVMGHDAGMRNALRIQLRKVLTATKAAIDEQAGDGGLDAGG